MVTRRKRCPTKGVQPGERRVNDKKTSSAGVKAGGEEGKRESKKTIRPKTGGPRPVMADGA